MKHVSQISDAEINAAKETKPLYQILNEKRVHSTEEWKADSDKWIRHKFGNVADFGYLVDAQLAALAVNNIANMAHALDACTKLFNAIEEQMPELPMLSHIGYQMTRDSAKAALKAIS